MPRSPEAKGESLKSIATSPITSGGVSATDHVKAPARRERVAVPTATAEIAAARIANDTVTRPWSR